MSPVPDRKPARGSLTPQPLDGHLREIPGYDIQPLLRQQHSAGTQPAGRVQGPPVRRQQVQILGKDGGRQGVAIRVPVAPVPFGSEGLEILIFRAWIHAWLCDLGRIGSLRISSLIAHRIRKDNRSRPFRAVRSGSQGCQTPRKIRLYILDVFQPDGDADQALPDPCRPSFLIGKTAVRGGRRVGNRCLGIAEIRGD